MPLFDGPHGVPCPLEAAVIAVVLGWSASALAGGNESERNKPRLTPPPPKAAVAPPRASAAATAATGRPTAPKAGPGVSVDLSVLDNLGPKDRSAVAPVLKPPSGTARAEQRIVLIPPDSRRTKTGHPPAMPARPKPELQVERRPPPAPRARPPMAMAEMAPAPVPARPRPAPPASKPEPAALPATPEKKSAPPRAMVAPAKPEPKPAPPEPVVAAKKPAERSVAATVPEKPAAAPAQERVVVTSPTAESTPVEVAELATPRRAPAAPDAAGTVISDIPAPPMPPPAPPAREAEPETKPEPVPAPAADDDEKTPADAKKDLAPVVATLSEDAAKPAPEARPPAPAPAMPVQTAKADPAPEQAPVSLLPSDMVRLTFEADRITLDAKAKDAVEKIAAQMKKDEGLRLQLLGYARGPERSDREAKRLATYRALAVRSHLIDNGIRSTRIDLRPQSNRFDKGPPDRVDMIISTR